jgi:hypothetical protein
MKASVDSSGGFVVTLEQLVELSAIKRLIRSAKHQNLDEHRDHYHEVVCELFERGKLVYGTPAEYTDRHATWLKQVMDGSAARAYRRNESEWAWDPGMKGVLDTFGKHIAEGYRELKLLQPKDPTWTRAYDSIAGQLAEEPLASWDGREPRSVRLALGHAALAVLRDLLEHHLGEQGQLISSRTSTPKPSTLSTRQGGGTGPKPTATPLQAIYRTIPPLAQHLPQHHQPAPPWQLSNQSRMRMPAVVNNAPVTWEECVHAEARFFHPPAPPPRNLKKVRGAALNQVSARDRGSALKWSLLLKPARN